MAARVRRTRADTFNEATYVATIEFSAQFGGQDAADIVLPHFRALKRAAKGVTIERLPYRMLSFILRVDGEINVFEASGLKHVDTPRSGDYISFDVGVTREDWSDVSTAISRGIMASVGMVPAIKDRRARGIDVAVLEAALTALCSEYRAALGP